MADLDFRISDVSPVPFAAEPQLAFRLYISGPPGETVDGVTLRCQIQIDAARRRYTAEEQARLEDLFGDPDRWSRTLRALLWTHAVLSVPRFTGATTVDLHVPCSFDFNVAATKYFHGVRTGDLPLRFLFSGSVFRTNGDGALQVTPIPWDREAVFVMPAQVWRNLMEAYYPNTAWMCLRRDVFEKLFAFKVRHGLPTWEHAVERALADAARDRDEAVPS